MRAKPSCLISRVRHRAKESVGFGDGLTKAQHSEDYAILAHLVLLPIIYEHVAALDHVAID